MIEQVLELLPQPPKAWKKTIFLALAFWVCREYSFRFREKSLKGDVALITGGAGGIGRLMALRLAKEGCTVIIWDMDEAGAAKVVADIVAIGGQGASYKVNVADRHHVYSCAKEVLERFGRVDILINNAGIVSGKKLFEADDARSELTIAVNTTALLWTTKAFIPGMIERKKGHCVTIASNAGRVGVSGMTDYSASKFGAVGFAESLRNELRHVCPEVKTTMVCPGYIATGMFQGAQMRSTIPLLNPLVNMLMPVLEPDYVAYKVVTAVKRNQTILVMPKFAYLSWLFRAFVPTDMVDLAMDILGVSKSMEKFEQTRA
jgi:all-trans-retinol dehydrogenase (NAD+)